MAKRAPMTEAQLSALAGVLAEVAEERQRQHAKWGEQTLRDGTGSPAAALRAREARDDCAAAAELGCLSWREVLWEEVCEALAESDAERLRAELVQVAAVAVQWVEAIDRRGGR